MTTVGTDVNVDLDGETLGLPDLRCVAEDHALVALSTRVLQRAALSREQFEETVRRNIPVYGVTTGYSEMIYILSETAKETELQTNLVRSPSAGIGPLLSEVEARAMVTARLNALAKGHSAVRPAVLERIALHLNEGLTPAVPEIGSLGAGGDLAPLAHLASTLMGEGYLLRDGVRTPTGPVLRSLGIEPLRLHFKEGLGLISGTSAVTGVAALVAEYALAQARHAEIAAALVIEVLQGSMSPFQPAGHEARPHAGQIASAANMRALMSGSRLIIEHADRRRRVAARMKNGNGSVFRSDVGLQQAYSLRCVPQVIGAVRDTLGHARLKLEIELNSATDNPLFFPDREIFHGQPVAFVMDFLTIALTQLGVLSERRSNRLLNRRLSDGLPEILIKGEHGLHRGFAGARYPATALVAENRTIDPASTHSMPSDGDSQDVVSTGLIATRNCRRVLRNNNIILALEFLAAAQAVDVSGRLDRLSPAGRITYDTIRSLVPTLDDDCYLADELQLVADELERGTLIDALHDADVNLQ
ncbi:tyrosine 2,3-aminomutase [Micromonospora sp. DR5-3]|uniref:tyrosine 2,3-aminomutase n=1 Tax=unclassified Micromonospora TaxID=2617518 RepID=UPI0011D2EE10|nr:MULTISPECIES: tyrosine 2,3-aminomutase [unclassified Micromonospora]MCW3818304.1 tyrosine 2,3-aminomutase [Micromonospora sp. DR5-3]TYC21179.1 tyrosine 2,3-aminomutase [Micromonospora sp. MP36]